MIQCTSVSKTYKKGLFSKGAIHAVKDVSFHIKKGSTFSLIGLSGSGKSTLGRLTLGLERVTSGSIVIDGKTIEERLDEELTFRKSHQILFQNPSMSLHPYFTIRESMEEPYRIHHIKVNEKSIAEVLDLVGLEKEVLNRKPHQMSGGQLQRICLSRILLLNPSYIVLDEATSMLDSVTQLRIIDLLMSLQRERGFTYLSITHDLGLAKYMSNSLGVMKDGNMIEQGDCESILNNPAHEFTKELVENFLFF